MSRLAGDYCIYIYMENFVILHVVVSSVSAQCYFLSRAILRAWDTPDVLEDFLKCFSKSNLVASSPWTLQQAVLVTCEHSIYDAPCHYHEISTSMQPIMCLTWMCCKCLPQLNSHHHWQLLEDADYIGSTNNYTCLSYSIQLWLSQSQVGHNKASWFVKWV